jgi:hypothetical protein
MILPSSLSFGNMLRQSGRRMSALCLSQAETLVQIPHFALPQKENLIPHIVFTILRAGEKVKAFLEKIQNRNRCFLRKNAAESANTGG